MAKEIIKLPEMRAIFCRCRDVSVIGGGIAMPEIIVPGKDCRCVLKPLRGKVRDLKTKEIVLNEAGDLWDAYIYPESAFRDLNENE